MVPYKHKPRMELVINMKKTLIPFTMAMLLLVGLVSAIPTPQPLSGVIDVYGSKANYLIKLEVSDSNSLPIELTTDVDGFYLWDFSGSLRLGDEIKITVIYKGNELASETIIYNGDIIDVPTIHLKNDECPTCPECEECEICEVCEECEECQTNDWMWILGILGILVGGGAGAYITKNTALGKNGVGLKIYTGRDGIVKTLHKHHGIRGYHDPETSHRDKDERHNKGELCPKYEKIEGKWVYVGD